MICTYHVVRIYQCSAVVTYEEGILRFEFRGGGSDCYIGSLADSVFRLLLKNGFVDKINTEKAV